MSPDASDPDGPSPERASDSAESPRNRLADERSPYLLQHADNPVHWNPWGPEALERARRKDRPILLSIGYSSCHWCHVMEHESFSDPAVARVQNDRFVNIKVDREERPDIDAIYMRAVQAMTGRGGWPLTVFLTPDGRPFYGGTYFPPEPRHGMPSFRQLLDAIDRAWREQRDRIEGSADELHQMLTRAALGTPARSGSEDDSTDPDAASGGGPEEGLDALPDPARATARLLSTLDRTRGGFGSAPKFPQPMILEALMGWARTEAAGSRTGAAADSGTGATAESGTGAAADSEVRPDGDAPAARGAGSEASLAAETEAGRAAGSEAGRAALLTLRRMAAGGIRDHLAGGYHRYSTDARWLVPHFEKMLYDNALLARAHLQGWQLSGDPALRREVEDTLGWLESEMRAPGGGFFAALDADSEGEEGRFYVWSADEIRSVLEAERSEAFEAAYGVREGGNWEGVNILHHPDGEPLQDPDEFAAERAELREHREQRERPFRDTKVLASWNGMALRAFAEAGAALERPDWIRLAADDLGRLLETLRDGDGRLRHQVIDGHASIPAFLDDVAALGLAALALHQATLEARWIREAVALADEVVDRFADPDTDRLMDTPSDGEELIVRPRETMDNAVPSGSSLAAELLYRLGRILGREEWSERARGIVAGERGAVESAPQGFGRLLALAVEMRAPPEEVAITGNPQDPRTQALLAVVHRAPRPGRVLAGGEPEGALAASPLLEGRGPVDGRPAAWVCRSYACRAPVTEPEALREVLEGD